MTSNRLYRTGNKSAYIWNFGTTFKFDVGPVTVKMAVLKLRILKTYIMIATFFQFERKTKILRERNGCVMLFCSVRMNYGHKYM